MHQRDKRAKQNRSNIKSIAFLILITFISVYLAYFYFYNKFGYHNEDLTTWKSSKHVNISEQMLSKLSEVKIKTREITFDIGENKLTVFIREHDSPLTSKISVLLLHGAGSSSSIWVKLDTLKLLGAMGLKVVAVDLPGWAKSSNSRLADNSQLKARFLQNLIRVLNLKKVVIVSPSMSGSYSIPYMMLPESTSCTERLLAFVPIAPIQTQMFTHAQYYRCEVPTMIVYGTNDTQLGLTSVGNLRNMPNMELREMMYAGHACYIDKPQEWNMLLYNFIVNLQHKLGEV